MRLTFLVNGEVKGNLCDDLLVALTDGDAVELILSEGVYEGVQILLAVWPTSPVELTKCEGP